MADQFDTIEEAETATQAQYDDIDQAERATAQSQLQGTVYTGTEKDPNRQAEIIKMSEQTKLPVDLVERNYDTIQKDLKRSSIDTQELITNFPKSSKFLTNPDNASVSHDDIDNLKGTEQKVKTHHTLSSFITEMMRLQRAEDGGESSGVFSWVSDLLKVGRTQTAEGFAKTPALFASAYNFAADKIDPLKRAPSDLVAGATPQRKIPEWLLDNEVYKTLKSVEQLYSPPELSKSTVDEFKAGNYKEAGRVLAAKIISNSPQQAVNLGLAFSGAGMWGALVPGVTTAATTNVESLNKGATPNQALANAALAGSIETAFERLGTFGLAEYFTKRLSKQVGTSAAKEVAKEFAFTMAASAAGEANEEFMTSLAQDYASYLTGVDKDAMKGALSRAIEAGLIGAGSGGMMTGPSAIGAGVATARQIHQSNLAKDLYVAMGNSAIASKVRERLPQKHKEFVDSVTKEGPVEKVFIPLEAYEKYFQGDSETPNPKAASFAGEVGIINQYEAAKLTGGPIEIPLSTWTEKVAGKPEFMAFQNDVKFNVDDLTVNEIKEQKTQAEAQVKGQDMAVRVEEAQTPEAQIQKRVEQFKTQLKAANMDAAQAELLSGIGTLALREGMNPEELFQELNLSIGVGISMQGGETFKQSPLPETMLAIKSKFGTLDLNEIQTEEDAKAILGSYDEDTAKRVIGRRRDARAQADQGTILEGASTPLENLPESSVGPNPAIRTNARQYANNSGQEYNQPTEYVTADPERGARIAQAFEQMKHDPENPEVKAAYAAMISETLAQYQAIKEMGIVVEVIKIGQPDPYPNGPKDVINDINNGHVWLFPTGSGFGSGAIQDNPLLSPTSEFIGDYQLLANDVFRIVHDVYGHAKEGVGFGPNGEENAWQSHVRMYSPLAAKAMTTETRGQNSWVNFGPVGESNRSNQRETVYAEQKVGLLPDWVMTEGLSKSYNQSAVTVPKAPPMYSKLIDTVMKKMGGSASIEQINGMLKDIKEEERQWSGLDSFIRTKIEEAKSGKPESVKIKKSDLVEYLMANTLNVEDVVANFTIQSEEDKAKIKDLKTELEGLQSEANNLHDDIEMARDEVKNEIKAENRNKILSDFNSNFSYHEKLSDLSEKRNQAAISELKSKAPELEDETLQTFIDAKVEIFKVEKKINQLRTDIHEIEQAKKSSEPKYLKWTFPEGQDNQEIRFTLPRPNKTLIALEDKRSKVLEELKETNTRISDAIRLVDSQHKDIAWNESQDFAISKGYLTQETIDTKKRLNDEIDAIDKQINKEAQNTVAPYLSSHFPEENIFAHVRLNVRTDKDGKTILFVEEVQSDWHQAGRKHGYKVDEQIKLTELKKVKEEIAKLESQQTGSFFENLLSDSPESKQLAELYNRRNELEKNHEDLVEEKTKAVKNIRYKLDVAKSKMIAELERLDMLGFDSMSEALATVSREENVAQAYQLTDDAAFVEAAKEYKKIKSEFNIAYAEEQDIKRKEPPLPDAPFKKTWHEFVMKRVIRMATERGIDRIAWPTGKQQAERFHLSKMIKSLTYLPDEQRLIAVAVDGGRPLDLKGIDHNSLEEHVGKEAAKTLLATKPNENGDHYLETKDLELGGEGMEGFYDKMLPSYVYKFGKKSGSKVGKTKISLGEIESDSFTVLKNPDEQWAVYRMKPSATGSIPLQESVHESKEAAMSARGELFRQNTKKEEIIDVHSFDISPELANTALNEGFSLFQNEESPRGQIKLGSRSIKIDLFEKADASTFIHETGHLYLEVLGRLAIKQNASQQIKDDLSTILNWFGVNSTAEITKEHHEKFADGFMTYVSEGNAPSKTLAAVFKRFKLWVIATANSLHFRKVKLSPEIRDVMARMLASEKVVEEVKNEEQFGPLFDAPASVGMNEEQALNYRRKTQEAKDVAVQQMNAELMAPLIKQQKADYKAKRDTVKNQVTKEVHKSKMYVTLAALQKHEKPDGTQLPTSQPQMKLATDSITKEERALLPRGIWAKDGMDPVEAAEILGFASGDDLIDRLKSTPPQNEFIEIETDKRMKELYPDLMNTPVMHEKAVEAFHNDARAEMLEIELNHLFKNSKAVVKDAIRRVTRKPPTAKAIREQAKKLISEKKIGEIKPYLYERAERKAAKEAGELLAKGDLDGAFEAKKRELLNHELYRASVDAVEQIENAKEKFNKIANTKEQDVAKVRDVNIMNAAKAVISQFWVEKLVEKSPDEYLAQLAKYDPEAYNVVKELVDSGLTLQSDFKQLTAAEFKALTDTVDALWSLSKTIKEIEIDGKRVNRDDLISQLTDKIYEFKTVRDKSGYMKAVSPMEKITIALLTGRAAMTRIEHWVDAVDVEDNGPFRKYIWNPISQGVSKYRLAKDDVLKQYKDILQEWGKTVPRGEIVADEIGYIFRDKTELMMALLHTGNMSNKTKLIGDTTRGWGHINEQGEVDTTQFDLFIERAQKQGIITKADYETAQKIWDLMESLKPQAQKTHKEMYGHYFSEITAQPITTPFGVFRGGYIPAKVDPLLSEDASIRNEKDMLENNNNSFQFPTTGRGFTKARVDNYRAPLSLELSMLGGHIDSVLRFIHIEPRVKEVSRIVTDKAFRKDLAELDPTIAKEALVPWLQRAAQQKVVIPSNTGEGKIVDATAAYLRKTVSMQIMFGNVVNTMQQITGLVVAMSKVKPSNIRNAMVTYLRDMKGTVDSMIEKSDFMRSTQGATIYESQAAIEEILVNPTVWQSVQDFATKHTYFLQSAAQNMVNTIVWNGAYTESIEKGNTEAQAILDADRAVRLTQGTTNPEDISRFETGTPLKRLFTHFASYFNLLANLNGSELKKISREVGLKKGAGKAFYLYTTAFMLPAVLSEVIVRAMSGAAGDDENDDGYLDDSLRLFFGSQMNTIMAMVPWAGQFFNTAVKRFNDKPFDDRLSLSPVVSTLESMAGVPASVYNMVIEETGNDKKTVKDSLMLLGVLTGVPVAPLGKPMGYLMDVGSGEAQPTGPLDYTRGLITGKKGKQ